MVKNIKINKKVKNKRNKYEIIKYKVVIYKITIENEINIKRIKCQIKT